MKTQQLDNPDLSKPIMIAAMQDMGNVGSITIDFINKSLQTKALRNIFPPFPNYNVDNGGHIEFERHKWEYRYNDNLIIFGGGVGSRKRTRIATTCAKTSLTLQKGIQFS